MQHQQYDLDGDDQAQIWRSAQHRRTEDIGSWFTDIFKKRQPLRSPDTRSFGAAALLRALTSQSESPLPSGHGAGGSCKGDSATGGQSGQ
jgi:hypothetical protein